MKLKRVDQMALQKILLVDGNKSSCSEIEAVMCFLDYKVATLAVDQLQKESSKAPSALILLTEGVDLSSDTMQRYFSRAAQHPCIYIYNKGQSAKIPKTLSNHIIPLEWPTNYQAFMGVLRQRQLTQSELDEKVSKRSKELFRSLVGHSQEINRVRELIQQVCDSEATVLILGESGTGKEVIARNIHDHSARGKRAFVPINCGAIPGELLESELFGHEKGAFTGALTARQGRFELAEGGTLFLDEIGDMPMQMQVKLLRVLQERTFERVGGNKLIHCNVRVLAATHRDLHAEIEKGNFREDLFYRLDVFPITIAPLRDRVEDIPMLISELVQRVEQQQQGAVRFTSAALRALSQHNWPGNVRELSNLVERLSITHAFSVVDTKDLPEKFQRYVGSVETGSEGAGKIEGAETNGVDTVTDQLTAHRPNAPLAGILPESGLDLKEHLYQLEGTLIQQALDETQGVVAHAAKKLNMRRTTLVEKMRKHELNRQEQAPEN